MGVVEVESQLRMFGSGEHELDAVAHLGDAWRSYCVCGWMSRIAPDRWRVVRHHANHVVHVRKEWHELV